MSSRAQTSPFHCPQDSTTLTSLPCCTPASSAFAAYELRVLRMGSESVFWLWKLRRSGEHHRPLFKRSQAFLD